MLRGFFEWIRRLQQASAVPVVIVAHNAFVTEGPHLMRACARAGLSFLDEMTSLGCVGLMDTMYVARCVPWKQIPKKGDTRIVIGTGDSAVGAGVALTELWKRAPKTAGAALATRADTVEEGDIVVLESVAAGEKDRLGLQVIYNHLLGEEFPESHQALPDSQALVRVVCHPMVWQNVVGKPVVLEWSALKKHADANWAALADANCGWIMGCDGYPACEHGPMKCAGGRGAASGSTGQVTFSCKLGALACAKRTMGPREGWVAPVAARAKPVVAKGEAGRCACTAKCGTNTCPCHAAGRACTAACHVGSKQCTNDVDKPPTTGARKRRVVDVAAAAASEAAAGGAGQG